jgi:hypothetical protein
MNPNHHPKEEDSRMKSDEHWTRKPVVWFPYKQANAKTVALFVVRLLLAAGVAGVIGWFGSKLASG